MAQRVALLALALLVLNACRSTAEADAPADAGAPPRGDVVLCEDSDDCPERALCQAGVCAEVGPGCVSKSECGAGLVCVAGTCATPPESCSSSEECPGALLCDGFSRTCFDPNATGCRFDSECRLEPGCEDGCTCEEGGACVPGSTDPTDPPDPTDPTDPEDPTDPTDPPAGEAIDLSGFVLENREHEPATQVGVLPEGTWLEPGQHLVIARDAEKADFEAYWQVSLGDDVIYLNARADSSGVPIVNGGERWAIVSPLGTLVDEADISGDSGHVYRRTGAARDASGWLVADAAEARPGQTSLPASGLGLVLVQWADAPGSGNYVYEFVELYYAP